METGEQVWFEDIGRFITPENYLTILPQSHMTLEEKLNSLVRFFIYLGVILSILKDGAYLFLGVVAGMVSIVLYNFQKKHAERVEKYLTEKNLDVVDNTLCIRPTVDNPFMNILQTDYADNPRRPEACNALHEKVQKSIDSKFHQRIFRDTSDIFNKMSSQREFYTMPNTMIPNDQEGFAEFLYGKGASCKEGNGQQCFNNLHVQNLQF